MNIHLIGVVFKVKYNGRFGVVKSVHGMFINLEFVNPANGALYNEILLIENLA